MKRKKSRRTGNDQLTSQVEGDVDGELHDDAISKASADYYEQSWKRRIKDRQLDIWIAVGLYLVLSSVAVVVF